MDSHNWYDFKDVKREVLPDGRIRYSAEVIVTERCVDAPIDPEEYGMWMARHARGLQNDILRRVAETSPFNGS